MSSCTVLFTGFGCQVFMMSYFNYFDNTHLKGLFVFVKQNKNIATTQSKTPLDYQPVLHRENPPTICCKPTALFQPFFCVL